MAVARVGEPLKGAVEVRVRADEPKQRGEVAEVVASRVTIR